jgi:nucleoside-diphosphate-sugar epimerase
MKTALVLGGGGFIGSHLVKKLVSEGFWVRSVDLKYPEYSISFANDFIQGDLRDPYVCKEAIDRNFDEIYQLAADMGGAGFVFTGNNDADIMHNSALINLNILDRAHRRNSRNIFYSSSACMYPEHNQLDPKNPKCTEDSAYPANPDSEYGWEKLFSERLFFAYMRNYGMNVRVARYHNIFGPEGTWKGGREKAPAAISRKVAESNNNDEIEIWGTGEQTRSFLYIDECVEATIRLMRSNFSGPVNIGSEEMISINELAERIIKISNKKLSIKNIAGDEFFNKYGYKCPVGVMGRNSCNKLYKEKINWVVSSPLNDGLRKTYEWINSQINE